MPENRYDGPLTTDDAAINALVPGGSFLRDALARTIKANVSVHTPRILDVGCGSAELGKVVGGHIPIAIYDGIDIKILDEAYRFPYMELIEADASEYLLAADERYDAVVSGWTIHNFSQAGKERVYEGIAHVLNPHGVFGLFEKVYTGDEAHDKRLLERQLKRYERLPKEMRDTIVAHEREDYQPKYRMTEPETLRSLEKHFSEVEVIDRIERDVVILCRK